MSQTTSNLNFLALLQELKRSNLYYDLQKSAQDEVGRSTVRLTDMKKIIHADLISSGMERKLRNVIYQYLMKHGGMQGTIMPPEHLKEPLIYLRKTQQNWEKRILKSLNSMCTELSVPLAKTRSSKDQKDLATRWTEMGCDGPDLSQIRPVYAPKDFLEVVVGLQNPNLNVGGETSRIYNMWGIIQIPLKVKDINELGSPLIKLTGRSDFSFERQQREVKALQREVAILIERIK